ncbi:MAG: tRNA uridine-5-carboxymethylaminomethyl(34) synthesis GTPase MnmE [Betaproteobacteria bacterium]|nr:tRNA uridine-5-carboxymethylaminomethyl(34) synthesis GTPase MnmE [Betaproteobacteria bacterium]
MTIPNSVRPLVSRETIAAIATATGQGGIGVVRISGKSLLPLLQKVCHRVPQPRVATLTTFRDKAGQIIDQGIALYFQAPHSYTGEDVIELQGHGGIAVLQRLLQQCLDYGCRLAEPGEFTRRAFLNNKLDLAQAESVADLIAANSMEAARSAARSLSGEFSARIKKLTEGLIELRMHVEACIDFPEEEIDPADRRIQHQKLTSLHIQLQQLIGEAKQGAILRDGLTVVLIGRPNVGKSSLLNCLAGDEVAIVTAVPGTTRDIVRATIHLNGVPIHLVDTAGLRDTEDEVEKIGIARTWAAIEKAGAALLIAEAGETIGITEAEILAKLPAQLPMAWIYNKIDNHGLRPKQVKEKQHTSIQLSALTGEGIDLLRQWLLQTAGWQPSGEGVFMARERHLQALRATEQHLQEAAVHVSQLELFAEELHQAQNTLSTITGEFTPDDLLGEIFSRFCIGK